MAIESTITIEGKTYELRDCFCKNTQTINPSGEPVSGVVGGDISLIMECPEDNVFEKWIADPLKKMDGTITFYSHEHKQLRKIEFSGAFAVEFVESFLAGWDNSETKESLEGLDHLRSEERYDRLMSCHSRTNTNYLLYLRIASQKIKYDGIQHENNWTL